MSKTLRTKTAARAAALLALAPALASCAEQTPPQLVHRCDPGNKTVHRLNRTEYDRTVKDLLGVPSTLASTFPPDDAVGGFDNNASVLSVSPLLVERLAAAADDAAAVAFPVDDTGPGEVRYGVRCGADDDVAVCAGGVADKLLPRAFRRPVDAAERAAFVRVVTDSVGDGDPFTLGVQRAVSATLLSPSFLFRVEEDVDDASHDLQAYELASRLSYFVWSSMPDDALFAKAKDGSLLDRAVLRGELLRMLDDDDKARGGIVEGLAGQWLAARSLDLAAPDPPLSDELRHGMSQETRLVVAALLHSDRPASDLVDLEFTFVNAPLADLYGVDYDAALATFGDDDGDGFVQASPPDRVGVLGHAAYLTSTSFPERTSPVKRGYFVVDRLLCIPPAQPPDDVPPLDETVVEGPLRERMAAHRASPDCAGCHALMDPIGFGLESYDPTGRHRDVDEGGFAIDDDDAFFGRPFHTPRELAAVIKSQERDLQRCIVSKVSSYALGRGIDAWVGDDVCTVVDVAEDAVARGFSFTDVLAAVVDSDAFRRRRAFREGDR